MPIFGCALGFNRRLLFSGRTIRHMAQVWECPQHEAYAYAQEDGQLQAYLPGTIKSFTKLLFGCRVPYRLLPQGSVFNKSAGWYGWL